MAENRDVRLNQWVRADEVECLRRQHQEAVQALQSLRAAWNEHMKTCSQHAKVPSFEEIEAWRNAPSNTASAALACDGEFAGPNACTCGDPRRHTDEF